MGDPRYGWTKMTDKEVRVALNVPSLDCCIRKRRLKYFSRLAAFGGDTLHAVLQCKGKHREHMPWVRLINDDLHVLRAATGNKLAELPCPTEDLAPYWALARDHPAAWKAIVELYFCFDEDCGRNNTRRPEAPDQRQVVAAGFVCNLCNSEWDTWRKLTVHRWSKHRI